MLSAGSCSRSRKVSGWYQLGEPARLTPHVSSDLPLPPCLAEELDHVCAPQPRETPPPQQPQQRHPKPEAAPAWAPSPARGDPAEGPAPSGISQSGSAPQLQQDSVPLGWLLFTAASRGGSWPVLDTAARECWQPPSLVGLVAVTRRASRGMSAGRVPCPVVFTWSQMGEVSQPAAVHAQHDLALHSIAMARRERGLRQNEVCYVQRAEPTS